MKSSSLSLLTVDDQWEHGAFTLDSFVWAHLRLELFDQLQQWLVNLNTGLVSLLLVLLASSNLQFSKRFTEVVLVASVDDVEEIVSLDEWVAAVVKVREVRCDVIVDFDKLQHSLCWKFCKSRHIDWFNLTAQEVLLLATENVLEKLKRAVPASRQIQLSYCVLVYKCLPCTASALYSSSLLPVCFIRWSIDTLVFTSCDGITPCYVFRLMLNCFSFSFSSSSFSMSTSPIWLALSSMKGFSAAAAFG